MPAVSHTDLDWFADKVAAAGKLFDQFAVRLQNQRNGLLKVLARLFERSALCVGAGQLFDETDVTLRDLPEHRGQLQGHGAIIRGQREA